MTNEGNHAAPAPTDNVPGEDGAGGFNVNTASLDEAHQKLIAVTEHFQGKADTLAYMETGLQDPFFRGHEGETGAFKRNYEVFGHEWIKQLKRLIALEQRFVNLIAAHGQAIKNAAAVYEETDDAVRSSLQKILDDLF